MTTELGLRPWSTRTWGSSRVQDLDIAGQAHERERTSGWRCWRRGEHSCCPAGIVAEILGDRPFGAVPGVQHQILALWIVDSTSALHWPHKERVAVDRGLGRSRGPCAHTPQFHLRERTLLMCADGFDNRSAAMDAVCIQGTCTEMRVDALGKPPLTSPYSPAKRLCDGTAVPLTSQSSAPDVSGAGRRRLDGSPSESPRWRGRHRSHTGPGRVRAER